MHESEKARKYKETVYHYPATHPGINEANLL